MTASILSKAIVFQTFEEKAFMASDPCKGGSRFTGKSDFFGAAESLNAALTVTKLSDYASNIGMTLAKVCANLPANALFNIGDMLSLRFPVALAGLVVNAVAKVFVVVALIACLLGAIAGLKLADKLFTPIENPKEIQTIEGSTV